MEIGHILKIGGQREGSILVKFDPLSNAVMFTKYKSNSTEFGLIPEYILDFLTYLGSEYTNDFTTNVQHGNFILYGVDGTTKNITIIPAKFKDNSLHEAVIFGLKWSLDDMNRHKFFRSIEEFVSFVKHDFMIEYKNELQERLNDRLSNTIQATVIRNNATIEDAIIELRTTSNKRLLECESNVEVALATRDAVIDLECNIEDIHTTISNMQDDLQKCVHPCTLDNPSYLTKTNNKNIVVLNPDNILDNCVQFYKTHILLYKNDIVEIIKQMLNTKEYLLGEGFKLKKLDMKEVAFNYKMLTEPHEISRDEILDIVFNPMPTL